MSKKIKLALFAVSSGLIALQSCSGFFRWLGDISGDILILRSGEAF